MAALLACPPPAAGIPCHTHIVALVAVALVAVPRSLCVIREELRVEARAGWVPAWPLGNFVSCVRWYYPVFLSGCFFTKLLLFICLSDCLMSSVPPWALVM